MKSATFGVLAKVLVLAGALLASPPLQAQTRAACVDEDAEGAPTEATSGAATPADPQPRAQMQAMIKDALERSHAVGASRLIAEAARLDIDEMVAGKAVQASATGGVGPGGSRTGMSSETTAAQLRATVNLSQLLYDGGRTDSLVSWRAHIAESARLGHLDQREQLALSTVGLALERGRYRTQLQVWRQNVRKMSCLVKALETIVRADRGRASELVQAQKSLEQAELSLSQAQSQVRQSDLRLRRLVGDGLPPTTGMATVFAGLPPLETLVADVDRAHEVAALGAQAQAASRYAEATAAADKPQLRWAVSGTVAKGVGGSAGGGAASGNYAVGLLVSVPLVSPGLDSARDAARKRAEAAALQRNEVLEARRWRVADLHEQALAAQDRLRRLSEVLRSSEQVRGFTLQQWQQMGRRSLFDVMSTEAQHYDLRVAYVNALFDLQQLNANLLSLGRGVTEWLR